MLIRDDSLQLKKRNTTREYASLMNFTSFQPVTFSNSKKIHLSCKNFFYQDFILPGLVKKNVPATVHSTARHCRFLPRMARSFDDINSGSF